MKQRRKQSYGSFILSLIFLAGSMAVFFVATNQVEGLKKDLVKNEMGIGVTSVSLDKEIYDDLENYWIDKDEAPTFVSLLENTAQALGVELTILSLRYENVEQKQYLVAELSFGGSWNAIVRFMEALSLLPYERTVQNVQIAQAFDGAAGWHGSALLKVRAFSR